MSTTDDARKRRPGRPAPGFPGLTLLALLGAACGHTKPSSQAIAPADAGDSPADALPGPRSATTEMVTVEAGGQSRILIVHVPASVRASVALVFNMHGSGGTAADQELSSGMDRTADANGFIVAYPQGAIALGSGFAWNVPGQPLSGGEPVPPGAADDAAFIGQAVASLVQRYPIDPKRVYATGMSGGGRMASQLGCDLSTILAAVAPVAGLRFPSPCTSARAVPVVAFHGTADSVNPYQGGGPAYWTYSVPSAAEQWAAHDGCGTAPTLSQPEPGVELSTYPGCAMGAAVQLYSVEGADHEWPGAPQQTNAIDASAVMWSFFTAHPLP
jgi:polyhydroxybutyrate depolymerase